MLASKLGSLWILSCTVGVAFQSSELVVFFPGESGTGGKLLSLPRVKQGPLARRQTHRGIICEVSEPRIRGLLGASFSLILILGILTVNIVGTYYSIYTSAVIFLACSAVFLVLFSVMPENRLQKLRASKTVEAELDSLVSVVTRQMSERGRFSDLVTIKSNKMAVTVMGILRFLQKFSGVSSFTLYAQLLFKEATDAILQQRAAMLMMVIQAILTLLAVLILDVDFNQGLTLIFSGVFFTIRDLSLLDAAQNGISQLTRAYDEVKIINVHPFELPELTIGAGKGPVAVDQKFKNCKLDGFHLMKLDNFEFDLEEKRVSIVGTFPEVTMKCHYDLDGKVLLVPIQGTGPSTIVLKNVKTKGVFPYEEFKKKDKTFVKVISSSLTLDPELVSFNFENLFNGDKKLGDNVNQVLNDNWREIFDDVIQDYIEVFNKILIAVFNNLFSKVSLEDAFD
ncbi:hypothetical protein GEV33_007138 [Tenebrio molitor]|uniref:Uncharacterized protein n=1 Tax=Tenebrio molitor TaxID=7067 RepID=A0A8J6HJV1_TENMO|nr:hypothetical protein GEV33_007138 [Tenebrio molitor]